MFDAAAAARRLHHAASRSSWILDAVHGAAADFATLHFHYGPHLFSVMDLICRRWGLSKLGIGDGALFTAVGEGALRILHDFQPQNLANAVYAYANLGINPGEEVLGMYAAHFIHKINEALPQNLSNMVQNSRPLLNSATSLLPDATVHTIPRTLSPDLPLSLLHPVAACRCGRSPSWAPGTRSSSPRSRARRWPPCTPSRRSPLPTPSGEIPVARLIISHEMIKDTLLLRLAATRLLAANCPCAPPPLQGLRHPGDAARPRAAARRSGAGAAGSGGLAAATPQ